MKAVGAGRFVTLSASEHHKPSRREYHSKTLPACPPERCFLPPCLATAPLTPSQAPALGHGAWPGVPFWPGVREPWLVPIFWVSTGPLQTASAIPVSLGVLQREVVLWDVPGGFCGRTRAAGRRGMPMRGCARGRPAPTAQG